MKRTIKIILSMVLVIFAAIAAAILAYYVLSYRPYNSLIKQKIENAAPEHRNLPQRVIQLVRKSESKDVIYGSVASNLLREFRKDKTKILYWHINSAAWSTLLRIHFKEDDIFTLWCEYVYAAGHYGFNNVAKAKFGKRLNDLTDAEIAAIIVINRSPTYYLKHPDKMQKRIDMLLNSGTLTSRSTRQAG